jgi:chemotaxis protein MotA
VYTQFGIGAAGETMKRIFGNLNQSTTIGLGGGLLLILVMILLAPEHIGAFFNIPGLIVVLGGTVAATLVSRPIKEVLPVLRQIPMLLEDYSPNANAEIKQLLNFAEIYRRGAVRLAEQHIETIDHPILSAGLRHIVDGGPRAGLVKLIRYRVHAMRQRGESEVQILRTMAVFAPAFGMLGTLFGLIHMLYGLGSSGIAEIGTAMAFAMITTLYGIIAANLFLKPLAMKLERRHQQQIAVNHMLGEGLLMVHERSHPSLILDSLESFGVQSADLFFNDNGSILANAA